MGYGPYALNRIILLETATLLYYLIYVAKCYIVDYIYLAVLYLKLSKLFLDINL